MPTREAPVLSAASITATSIDAHLDQLQRISPWHFIISDAGAFTARSRRAGAAVGGLGGLDLPAARKLAALVRVHNIEETVPQSLPAWPINRTCESF